MSRPPLTEEQVRTRVLAYCERYQVSPGPEGLPPFPSGKRETRQHREWLTVYRAHQRSRLRSLAAPASSDDSAAGSRLCPICARTLEPALAVLRPRRTGKPARIVSLHPTCAELARLAETVGPEALARLAPFLWPGRARTRSSPRPPRG